MKSQRYEDWIRTLETELSVEERILDALRPSSKAAFEADDRSFGATPKSIAVVVGGSPGRIAQRLELMQAEGLVTSARDRNNARIVRWFIGSGAGIDPTQAR
jgi:hypothetical protein